MDESAILEALKAIENHINMIAGLTLSMFMLGVAILIYVIANYNKK